jgi:hypothetical protein
LSLGHLQIKYLWRAFPKVCPGRPGASHAQNFGSPPLRSPFRAIPHHTAHLSSLSSSRGSGKSNGDRDDALLVSVEKYQMHSLGELSLSARCFAPADRSISMQMLPSVLVLPSIISECYKSTLKPVKWSVQHITLWPSTLTHTVPFPSDMSNTATASSEAAPPSGR